MSVELAKLVLYPAQSLKMNSKQQIAAEKIITSKIADFKKEDIPLLFGSRASKEEIKNIASSIAENDRSRYYDAAKEIVEAVDVCKETLIGMAELAAVLHIDPMETGFDVNIFKTDEINEFEFLKTVRTFAKVSAAIGFIPFWPITDFFIITPIQVGMVTKIANIYDFEMDPKEFLKVAGGVVGAGIVFKTASRIICSIVPLIGWAVNSMIAYAGTYAMGVLAKGYIEAKGDLNKESIKKIWEKAYEEGKEEFNNIKDYILRKREDITREFKKHMEGSDKKVYDEEGSKKTGNSPKPDSGRRSKKQE